MKTCSKCGGQRQVPYRENALRTATVKVASRMKAACVRVVAHLVFARRFLVGLATVGCIVLALTLVVGGVFMGPYYLGYDVATSVFGWEMSRDWYNSPRPLLNWLLGVLILSLPYAIVMLYKLGSSVEDCWRENRE